ncbi:aspartyl/asparaginyl beta-hydroxylase domain-containing protein [Hoeflea prorocentri]|uniref:Aspartyl/asparaginyl beta-hydroxylase domain-containing protein n=1 Tax=Hoeflea prorocentri TaxID=1922333 RepID=A0A9X3UP98_9HYPH|nr:aspartyl/asparaginyl beta-hydroxylase domain-containing protein [Hoeflea prorocentri]MCY6382894.1 aspartyl/asparaginyl beta-hydroxylase domain-containing protein [Hoeflea prorocentri]MDA5400694.1 aspartyl/asparaginyl beta-hydroxylase domain-containing protein [Hoeflea prorocentri]
MSKENIRILRVVVVLAVLFYFLPVVALIFVVCGLIDIGRHRKVTKDIAQLYFTGNGIPTWLLSPVNLFFDLISFRNKYVYKLEDFPPEARQEIESVLKTFDDKRDEIIDGVKARMNGNKRGMLFYKWYDRDTDESVPEFNQPFTYVKTIGLSAFSEKETTSRHFGPLRLTVRVLYNLSAFRSDNVFIEVDGKTHYWHDDPLFIFDDTLEHRSVNNEDRERYCVFVDVLRPSSFTGLQNAIMGLLQAIFVNFNNIFYKNWSMLK